MFFHIFEWQGKKSDDRKKKIEVRNSIKIILYDFLSVLLVNGERIAEPDELGDGNIILNKTLLRGFLEYQAKYLPSQVLN